MIKKLLSTTVLLFCCLTILGNNTATSKTTVSPPSLPEITLCEGENLELTAEDAGTGADAGEVGAAARTAAVARRDD